MSAEVVTKAKFFRAVCEAFGICPNTGRVVFSTKGDDKAYCGCGKTATPADTTPGVHLVRLLQPATAEDMARQFHAERSGCP